MSDDRRVVREVLEEPELFTVTALEGGAGLMLVGELDSQAVAAFNAALARLNGQAEVTLDLSALTFIDSSGMHAIVAFARSRDSGGTVTLTAVSPFQLRLFEITGLVKLPNLRVDGRA